MNKGRRLYLITPAYFDPVALALSLEDVLSHDGVACVQLRWKNPDSNDDSSDDSIIAAARPLARVCHRRDIPLIINDRPDLVQACDAQGAHIGSHDMACDQARDILGSDAFLGVSCGDSRHQAYEAGGAGADYVAFGPCFPSESKVAERPCIDAQIFTEWSKTTCLPSVAIGGIRVDHVPRLLAKGADYLAVIGAIWNHPQGAAVATEQFCQAFADYAPGEDEHPKDEHPKDEDLS